MATVESNGSINPTDFIVWGWDDETIIGWDDDTKIGGAIEIDPDAGSIDPT